MVHWRLSLRKRIRGEGRERVVSNDKVQLAKAAPLSPSGGEDPKQRALRHSLISGGSTTPQVGRGTQEQSSGLGYRGAMRGARAGRRGRDRGPRQRLRRARSARSDHRLARGILCAVVKPGERSPAGPEPAVVLKMQTIASGRGIWNRRRTEAPAGRPAARPPFSTGDLDVGSWSLPLYIRTQKKGISFLLRRPRGQWFYRDFLLS